MHNFIDIDIILKRGIVASVEVCFEVSSNGHRGDHIDPPESNRYEVVGVNINNVMCFWGPRHALRITRTWRKTGPELVQSGWHNDFYKLVLPLLDYEYYEEWQRLADEAYNTEPSTC